VEVVEEHRLLVQQVVVVVLVELDRMVHSSHKGMTVTMQEMVQVDIQLQILVGLVQHHG
jgi:hypothetical protein